MLLAATTFEIAVRCVVNLQRRGSPPPMSSSGFQLSWLPPGFLMSCLHLLEWFAVVSISIFIVGDFNIHVGRRDNWHVVQLRSAFESYTVSS
jgi:hypothetical protein